LPNSSKISDDITPTAK